LTLASAVSLSLLVPGHVGAQNGKPPTLNAEAVLLQDAEGKILFAKNAEESHAPASLVKLMTLYLAFKDLAAGRVALGELVTIGPNAAHTHPARMGLRVGETVPFELLLKGVAIASANDAATAVAEHLSGDEQSFVDRMNAEADALGLTATRFANPHGLPNPYQRSTAKDLATLTAKLLQQFPAARTFLGGTNFVYRGQVYTRRIPLFQDPWGVQALKTGFSSEAGYNLVVAASRDGQSFLAILLGAHSRGLSFLDARKLLYYGFVQAGVEPPTQERHVLPRRRGSRTRTALPPPS
jgi:D-alanyl-D-alanine carboxypeptidase (penicillin-binding protein 5/6)